MASEIVRVLSDADRRVLAALRREAEQAAAAYERGALMLAPEIAGASVSLDLGTGILTRTVPDPKPESQPEVDHG